MGKIWEKMGNLLSLERAMGSNRNNMESHGGPATHSPKYETQIIALASSSSKGTHMLEQK